MARTLSDLKNIAQSHGWTLNPNEKIVNNVLKACNNLKQKFGEYYCPCMTVHNTDTICPCKSAEKDIKNKGKCHCNLFYAT